MPDSYSIDEPNTLFTLPQPIDQVSGKTRAGPVFGINGSRKRKRSEVVVGVDGECLNIFNIQTPRLVATYALPPQTYLNIPPVSTRVKSNGSGSVSTQRFTYLATRNELAGNRQQLLCFQDSLNDTHVKSPLVHTRDVTDPSNTVAHIEPIAFATSSLEHTHSVVVTATNGNITLLSADLQNELGHGKIALQEGVTAGHHVELVSTHDPLHARATLLASRPDLAIQLDEAIVVLMIVMSADSFDGFKSTSKSCHVVSIRPSRFGQTSQMTFDIIISWPLPTPEMRDLVSKDSDLLYDNNSAILYQRLGDGISVMDFKQTSPMVASEFRISSNENVQLLPIARSFILVCSQDRAILYNSHYGTPQAVQKIGSLGLAHAHARKRKRANSGVRVVPITPIEFFQDLNIIVCLVEKELISLGLQLKSSGRGRGTATRLIDSLGRSQGLPPRLPNQDAKERYDKFRSAVYSEDPREFDQSFAQFIENNQDLDEKSFGSWLIGMIFDWNRDEPLNMQSSSPKISSIKVKRFARQALNWIIRHSLLNPSNVVKALSTLHGTNESLDTTVSDSDLVLAIARADPSLSLLAELLNHLKLGIAGYVESFSVLMESFNPQQSLKETHLLKSESDKIVTNGLTEQQLDIEENAALEELELATMLLDGEFDARGTALKICVERLGTNFPPTELVQALRHGLSHREISMLIDVLRIELDQAGWTSRRLDFHPSYDTTENQNEAIAVICKLLNCALDAIGTAAWLSRNMSLGEVDDMDATISLLRADTSAVLEGVQESTFFSSFLKDFIRFEAALKRSNRKKRGAWPANEPPHLTKSMLPLGLKEAHEIASTQVKAGGEIRKRTAREIGLEISQKVGKYSFETIRI